MNFSRFTSVVFAVGLIVNASTAKADQQLLPAQSDIVFVSKQMGVPVEGRFKKFDAKSVLTLPNRLLEKLFSPWTWPALP